MDYEKGDELFFDSEEDMEYFSSERNFPNNPQMTSDMIRILKEAKSISFNQWRRDGKWAAIAINGINTRYVWDIRWFEELPSDKKVKYVDKTII